MAIILKKKTSASVANPASGRTSLFVDTADNLAKLFDGDTGLVSPVGALPGRLLTAGDGLSGGGDLTADRTFTVNTAADGSIVLASDAVGVGVLASDAQHGNRGGGALHPAATGVAAGFMTSAQFNYVAALQGSRLTVTSNAYSNLVCDGVTDDSAALQLLYNSAPDRSTLIWPDNQTMYLGSGVSIPTGKHFAHVGAGVQKTWFLFGASTGDMITVNDWQNTFTGISFQTRSFTVTGNQAITGGAQTLNITGGLVLPATGVATIPSSDAAGTTASWVVFTFTARTATTITGTASGTGSGRTGIPFGGAAVTGTGYFRSGGYAINAGTNTGIYIASCDFTGMYNGILLNGTLCSIQDSQFAGTINFDMQFNGPNVNSIVHNVTCDGSPPAVAHIEVNQCGSLLITDCDLIRAQNNLRLNSSNVGAGVFGVYAVNTFFDTSVGGSSVKLTGNGFIQRVKFTSCWMSSAPATFAGLEFASTAATLPTAIDVVNCDFYANTTNGILANGVQDFAVSDSRIAGSTNGIQISASTGSVTEFRIASNAITATGGFAAPTTPIRINAGAYGGYQIVDNDLRGGTTPLFDAGTTPLGGKIVATNLGLLTTPAPGTAALLLSGTTYVTPPVVVPANSLRVGTAIQFTLLITTSVGASNTSILGKFGTAGTTADATVVSAGPTTGTAAAGSAEIMVTMVVRAVGSSGTAVLHARWLNNGTTGFANAASGLTTTTATINTTVTNYVGVALAASASGVTTVQSAIGNVLVQ